MAEAGTGDCARVTSTSARNTTNSSPDTAAANDHKTPTPCSSTSYKSDQGINVAQRPANPGCTRCANNLTAALLSSTSASGPRALLRAMGATASIVSHATNSGRDSNGSSSSSIAGIAEAVITVPPITQSNRVGDAPSTSGGIIVAQDEKIRQQRQRQRRDQAAVRRHDDASRTTTTMHVDKEGETILGNIRRRITGAATLTQTTAAAAAAAVATPSTVATSAAVVPTNDDADRIPSDDEAISVSISCQPCSTTGPEGGARAYVRGPHPLSIVLCSNRLSTPAEVEEVLVHELVHVFDLRVRGLDLRDCHQLAYSEVRAAREAECRGSLNRFTESMCVKGRAGVATSNMFPGGRGRDCVGRVLEAALADRSPFQPSELPDFSKWVSPK